MDNLPLLFIISLPFSSSKRKRAQYTPRVWHQFSGSTTHPGRCQRSAPCGHWLQCQIDAEAKHENCQTRCRCVSRIVPGHSETTRQGCLSKLLCLCWMQYVGRLVPINTNSHPQKSSGILVYLFFLWTYTCPCLWSFWLSDSCVL